MHLRSKDLWAAIDRIADERGLTASALAQQAGLDPTCFNKSKRIRNDGHGRWPASSSIARVLEVTGMTFVAFAANVERSVTGQPIPKSRIPKRVRGPREDPPVQPGIAGK